MGGKETKLNIVIDAQDKTAAAFGNIKKGLGSMSVSVEGVSSAMKKVGTVGLAAFTGLAAFLGSSLKSYGETQQAVAKVDATLKAMENTTRTVVTGTKEVASALKLTGTDAADAQNKIAGLNLKLQEQQMALRKLKTAHADGDISTKEFNLKTQQLQNSMESNRISIQKYQAALTATDKTTVNLTKTTKGIGMSFDEAKGKILQASKAAVRLGFDDEAAAVSITKLFQRTGDLAQAINLNNLAMDLARNKNIDLEDASRMVSLVLSGNARALKEYGIELDDTKTPLQAIAELQGMLSGQAEEATKSITVQMLVLKETFSNLQDAIAATLAPLLTDLLVAVTPYVEKLKEWIEANPELAKRLLLVALAITGILAVMLPLGMALPGIILAFYGIGAALAFVATGPGFLIVGSILAIIAVLQYLYNEGYFTRQAWIEVWDGIKIMSAEGANAVIAIFEGMVNWIVDKINSVIDKINSLLSLMKKIPGVGGSIKTLPTLERADVPRLSPESSMIPSFFKASGQAALSTTQVIFTGNPTFLSENVAEMVGDLIMNRLKKSNPI